MKEIAIKVWNACEDYLSERGGDTSLVVGYFPNREIEYVFRCCLDGELDRFGEIIINPDGKILCKSEIDTHFESEITERLVLK